MKRSQINYVIDKAHAIAQTFRVCLPEFAYFTVETYACGWPGPTKPISVMINESLP